MRKIIHIDMDCFFAAVEERDNPHLRGKAMAVGGKEDRRGVLCTANYEAREYGVRSAMSTAHALRLCPHLIVVPTRGVRYKEVSNQVFNIFRRYTVIIQPISLDEAFLDVSNSPHCHGSATLIAQEIRQSIQNELDITASAGIANNKFLAKIASDLNKPNGQFLIAPEEVDDFVKKLPVSKIWGVGKVTAKKLKDLGIQTCADLQNWELKDLNRVFGSFGQELYNYARGHDERPVKVDRVRKSFSQERTFPRDLAPNDCAERLTALHEFFAEKLKVYLEKNKDFRIKGFFVKVKFSDFKSTTVDRIGESPHLEDYLELLKEALSRKPLRIRLLGCGVRFHEGEVQEEAMLFEE